MTKLANHLLTLAVATSTIVFGSACVANTEPDDSVEVEYSEQALSTGWKKIGWGSAGVYHQTSDLCEYRQIDSVPYGKWVYHTGNTLNGCALGQMCSAHYDGKAGWIRCSALR